MGGETREKGRGAIDLSTGGQISLVLPGRVRIVEGVTIIEWRLERVDHRVHRVATAAF
jgi:hypothetical protein